MIDDNVISEVVFAVAPYVKTEEISDIRMRITMVLSRYDIKKAVTDVVPYQGDVNEQIIKKVEKALGIKLYPWQISYINRETWRRAGFSTAKCLRRLLVDDGMPRELTRIIYVSADAEERFEQRMLIEIMQKLKTAGVECNTFVLRKRHMHTGERGTEVRWP